MGVKRKSMWETGTKKKKIIKNWRRKKSTCLFIECKHTFAHCALYTHIYDAMNFVFESFSLCYYKYIFNCWYFDEFICDNKNEYTIRTHVGNNFLNAKNSVFIVEFKHFQWVNCTLRIVLYIESVAYYLFYFNFFIIHNFFLYFFLPLI